ARAAFVFAGEATDVQIEGCRVAEVGAAVTVPRREPAAPVRFTLASSTFYKVGTLLDLAAVPPHDKYGPAGVQGNLVVGGRPVAGRDGGARPARWDWLAGRVWNGCDRDLPGGALLGCEKVDVGGLNLLPDSDREFLRYAKSSPLFRAAPGEKPAGAPPVED